VAIGVSQGTERGYILADPGCKYGQTDINSRGHNGRPKPAIVEASVSAATMIDISESIGVS